MYVHVCIYVMSQSCVNMWCHSQSVGYGLISYKDPGSKIETHNLPVMKCDMYT